MSKYFSSKLLSILIVLLIVFSLGSIASAQENVVVVEPGDPVVIGMGTNLSLEGMVAFGVDIQRGAEMALEDRPTVTVEDEEFPLELVVEDSGCLAEGGQPLANRFTSDESIVGVIGHMCTPSTLAALPIYDSADFTIISASATNPSLVLRGFTSFNRAVVGDNLQGSKAAQFIFNELGITRIATIHDGGLYGEGLVQVVTENFEALGGEVVAADAVTTGEPDYRPLLEEIAQSEPDLIYFGGYVQDGARLIQQRADAGMEDVIFMGADGIKGPELVELAGEDAEGVYASAALPALSEEYEAFLERYIEAYDEEPPGPYHANSYDAFNIFADAVEAVGELDEDGNLVIDRAALREYVRSFEDFQGLTGVLNADGTGETALADIGFYQVEDGEFVLLLTMGAEGEEEESE
jgi:branched-chain amino acid transport system substrate-binding protein